MLGAVVITHRQPALALECVRALRRDLHPEAIVVVVNLPGDADPAGLRALRAEAGVVIENDRPAGYGANANRGAARLAGACTAYLILNDDAIPAPGAVAVLADAVAQDGVALAGPAIVGPDGRVQADRFRFPTPASELTGLAILPRRPHARLRRRLVLDDGPVDDRDRAAVDWVLGAAFAVDATAWARVGGFDERYFLWMEETDLAARLREAGWTAVWCAGATVTHIGGASTSAATSAAQSSVFARSRARYVATHWRPRQRIAFAAGQPLVFAWNVAYVAARVLAQPSSRADKRTLLAAHWSQRIPLRYLLRVPGPEALATP